MNKISCEIINDIMPLYVEDMASDGTKRMVEEHIEECLECRSKLSEMKQEIDISIDNIITPMTFLKRKLFQRKISIIILSVLATFTIIILGIVHLTSPIPLEYNQNLISFEKLEDGGVLVTISKEVAGYNIEDYPADSTNVTNDNNLEYIYHITLWKSLWSGFINNSEERSFIINKNSNGEYYGVKTVYYYAGDINHDGTIDSMDLPIYGEDMDNAGDGKIVSLPRLMLSYYFDIAFLIAVVSGLIYKLTKKHIQIRKIAEKIMLLAISYIIGQICIKGLDFSSYYLLKDLSGILLMMIPIFCMLLIILKLIQRKNISTQNHTKDLH